MFGSRWLPDRITGGAHERHGFTHPVALVQNGEQVDLRFAVEKNLDLNHLSGVASGKSGNVTSVNDSAASAKEAVDKEGQSTEGKKEDTKDTKRSVVNV